VQQSFANNTIVRQTMRDLGAPFLSRQSGILLVTLAVLAGLIGPFGTYDAFAPELRFLYWTAIIAATSGVGHAATSALERVLRGWRVPLCLEITAIALLAAVPVCLVVAAVSLTFGFNAFPAHLPVLYLQCVAVLACVAILFHLAEPRSLPEETQPSVAAPAVLRLLPADKRGRLLQLNAQDHYVEVVTDKGRTLLPMRFRDAIAKTQPEAGLQCHRSHWVALHTVCGRTRREGRSGLLLSCGSFIPIGRTFSASVKQALENAEAINR